MKKKIGIILLIICIGLCGYGGYWWFNGGETYYRYTFHKNHEPFTFYTTTSTSSIYSDRAFKKTLQQYDFFANYDIDQIVEDSIVIPGLKATLTIENSLEQDRGICTSMTPQGVAITEDYVLISAYCYRKEHHSVIYVVNRNTHEFVKEIVLPDLSHVGSIAYDYEHQNVWVCSHDNSESLAYVQAFSLETLENYQFTDHDEAIVYDQSYPIITQVRASFMTYYDSNLYVGYYQSQKDEETTVQRFEMNEDGGLTMVANPMMEHYDDPSEIVLPNSLTIINGGAQGVTQDEESLYILTSGGSANDSILYRFNNTINKDGNIDARAYNAISIDALPPMAEELYLDGDTMYICFESAAYAYRGRNCPHVDRILVFQIQK